MDFVVVTIGIRACPATERNRMVLEEPTRPLRTAYYLGYWLVEMRSRAETRWYASDVWPGLLAQLT